MAKTKRKSSAKEPDSVFLLKVVLYFLLGTMWIRFGMPDDDSLQIIGIPIGMIVGLYFASHDHFQIDRKIEYVVLLIAMAVSYVSPIGFVLIV